MILPEDPKNPGCDALGSRLRGGTHYLDSALAEAEHPLTPPDIGKRAKELSVIDGNPSAFNLNHPHAHLNSLTKRGYAVRVARGLWQLTNDARRRIQSVNRLAAGPKSARTILNPKGRVPQDADQMGPTADRRCTSFETVIDDVRAIDARTDIGPTIKKALVNARVGQGKFRADVLKLWNGRCAVSGCYTADVLRASHIKPWRDSTNEERLDPRNGLALAATWDALFDAGLITFDEAGSALISPRCPHPNGESSTWSANASRRLLILQQQAF